MQKDWLSFDEQLELLAHRGMRIEDECTAVQVLSRVSYYRFSGYFRGYRTLRVAGVLTFRCAGVEKSVF